VATEIICPSPFAATGNLDAGIRIELDISDSYANILWNSADKDPDITLSNNDLTAINAGVGAIRATESKASGKWYWEVMATGGAVGIGTSSAGIGDFPGRDAYGYGYHSMGRVYHFNSWQYRALFGSTDIIGVALDLDNNKLWFLKNNVPINGGDPAAGTGEDFSGLSGTFFPMWGGNASEATAYFNFSGQTYSPPTGFSILQPSPLFPPFTSTGSLSVGQIFPGFIDLNEAFSAESSFNGIIQPEISASAISAIIDGQANLQIVLNLADPFVATTSFSCDHCFNYVRIVTDCPTPTCEIATVFRDAKIDADVPVPTASFKIGRIIEGYCPIPGFTCTAYSGRNPSIIASAPCPTCSMRIGLSFSGDVSVPICNMVADTHHLTTIYGRVPVPLFTCIGDTENITIISGTVPIPTGLFEVTVGNVASIFGRSPCPYCTMVALTGQVVTLSGRVPIPGDLVRFYASLANDTIILTGTVPTPTMTSSIDCFISSILRHVRGKIR